MYLVVACPRCRKAKVALPGRKTTTCGHCGGRLTLADLRAATAGTVEDAQHAAGALNARGSPEFAEAVRAAEPAVARRARRADASRVDDLARDLSREGAWTTLDLALALEREGLDPDAAEEHLARLVRADRVIEPTVGRYRTVRA